MQGDPGTVTQLLTRWKNGDRSALDGVVSHLYRELRRQARYHLRGERTGHTLDTTELVHETYLRLVGADVDWKDRAHFLATAARQMRRILVDQARARGGAKRGRGQVRVALDEVLDSPDDPPAEILELEVALEGLAARDPRMGRVVEMHVFGGMTYAEIAFVLGVSEGTARRDMRIAKAWLRSELSRE